MKYCTHCGNLLDDSALFCSRCGIPFAAVVNQQLQKPQPPKPNSNMVLAIITTVCFCFAPGVYATILACKVDSLYTMGKYEEAQVAADDAKKWSIIGITGGIIGAIIDFLLLILVDMD